ncbi:MAG: hypothetical protein A2W90_06860 [Bacteroidetes bacterium GWF2_42_66]|nr:MAG: hypothetical protein A2W92_01800 [Bacteroidetes bacterium GWA2_42_15]OFY02872.1 MAG: hypothetical protein A2W89_24265 [Bacteroidetes bacterium GWE2_42_39]OFY44527.1 MAG: hypothetical protein A2W90_06860 [Bacteroidetes bacterium GWF2_42_66]HAZ04625.1 hypothetical protein [Marinilabiliales bacterium]HBL74926.1 hypothetical protein [Prolixibacteraceae bacterium]
MLNSILVSLSLYAQITTLEDYNIQWNTPGINSQGSMPIGNGDIGANVWVEENGDLVFYVSKTDAWNEYGHLLKLGKIRISIHPSQYNNKSFSQKLELEKGRMIITYGDTRVKLWADANHPTIQVDIDSKTALQTKVFFETWRKSRIQSKGLQSIGVYGVSDEDPNQTPMYQVADTTLKNDQNCIISCHQNTCSQWKGNLILQSLGAYTKTGDPLLNRTFGVCIQGTELISTSDTSLVTKSPSCHSQININALTQIGTVSSWKKAVLKNVSEISKLPPNAREMAHVNWWHQFWNRSSIFITARDTIEQRKAEMVTSGYILQRYINACGGRGNSPIKFNGSIFTVDTYNRKGKNEGCNADFRLWGGPYWWQNTRLPYWSMLMSGDFDMMKPLFKMYMDALPLRKLATSQYYHHKGAFFPETMNFWGTYTNTNYGINRENMEDGLTSNTYIRYLWQGGLELSLMMLDYYSFTNNNEFARDTIIPFVSEILTFFDEHWQRGDDGKILFSPAMSLETYQTAINPLPEIAGLRKVVEKMLLLPQRFISDTQRSLWSKLINDLPEVPKRVDKNNDTIIAPAAEYRDKKNTENPELYAVFPYRTFGVGKPEIDLAERTFFARVNKQNRGWQQNSIQAACLGKAEEAKKMIVESFSTYDTNFRFPAFWGPNYDWTPDQDHGSVAMNALQRMIMQYEDHNVHLLPAWPNEWDVRFILSGPNKTHIEGTYENGKLTAIKVSPANKINLIKCK